MDHKIKVIKQTNMFDLREDSLRATESNSKLCMNT